MANSKSCERCGAEFPTSLVIDGKLRNFQRRKYCLECSPFGAHNTKRLTSDRPLRGGPCRVCGRRHRRGGTICPSCQTKVRRWRAKLAGIKLLGGACSHCGLVPKHPAAFQFHHVDPSTKEFEIGNLAQRAWEYVKKEILKCELLCANCHLVHHATPLGDPIWEEVHNYSGSLLDL